MTDEIRGPGDGVGEDGKPVRDAAGMYIHPRSPHADPVRPPRTYRTGVVTVSLRWIAIGAALAFTALGIVMLPWLPDRVPTHFGVSGEADAWGSKYSLLVLLPLALAMVVGFSVLSRHPRFMNLPIPSDPDAVQHVYREGERLLVWLTLALAALYGCLIAGIVFSLRIGPALFALPLAGLVAALVVGLIRASRASRRVSSSN